MTSYFSRISYGTKWSGSGSTDWLGRPVLLNNNSTWITVYRQASAHAYDPNAKFHIRFSTDEGANWTAVDTFTDSNAVTGFPIQGHSSNSIMDVTILKAPNGDLLINTNEALGSTRNGSYQYRSTNNGASWSDEGKINNDNELVGGQDYVVVGSTIYLAVFKDPGANNVPPYYSALYKSINNGTSWTLVSNITSTTENTNEPGIEYLGGSTLLCILKDTNNATTYQRKSTDMGLTWGSLTNIGSQIGKMSKPKLIFSDDLPTRLYVTGSDKQPPGITQKWSAISYTENGGSNWAEIFHPDTTYYADSGYCDMLIRNNGKFYMLSYGGTSDTASIKEYIFEKFRLSYEDFTTFTEVDVAGDRIQKTANHIDHRAERDETTYLYKDYSAAHFADFTHRIKAKTASAATGNFTLGYVWFLSTGLGDYIALKNANKTSIMLYLIRQDNGDYQVVLKEVHSGSAYNDMNNNGFTLGDWIYAKIVKSGTALTAYLYSDSNYSTLIDTLSLTLHADHSFQYLYGCNTYDDNVAIHLINDIENFDLGTKHFLRGSISATSNVTGVLKVSPYSDMGCVMTYEGGDTYNDQTVAANNATINDVQPMFDTVGDILYYGDSATFAGAKIKYSTKGVIGSAVVVMEYSKGSDVWSTLTCTDGSNKFTEDPGTYILSFTPPGDWATDTVDGKTHYWIQYRLTNSSYDTNPILDQIWTKFSSTLVELVGSCSATSNVTGSISVSRKIAGTISCISALTGALSLKGYEDFTTFTEVDVGADRIQKTANHVDHLSYRNEVTYLYKDYGVDYFTDFTHKIKIKVISSSVAWSASHTWLIANDIAGSHWMEDNNETYISAFLLTDGSNISRIYLREMYNGSANDDYYVCSFNTWYYLKIAKVGTTLTAYIYSDSDYSNLLDTLVITLHADHNLQYLYGCNSDNNGTDRNVVLDIENFALDIKHSLIGSLSATSNVTGSLSLSRKIVGSTTSISTLAGALSCAKKITGTIASSASVAGSLTKYIALAGDVSAISAPRLHIMRRRAHPSCHQVRLFNLLPASLSVQWSLKGSISAISSPRVHIIRRSVCPSCHQVRLFNILPASLRVHGPLKGSVDAISSLSGTLSVERSLAGSIPAITSMSGALARELHISGTVSSTSSVSGTLTKYIAISGATTATTSVSASLSMDLKFAGAISGISSVHATLSVPIFAEKGGFYYAKLGSTILTSLEKDSFRITEELNKIPSFEFEIANCADNRTAIAAGITEVFRIYHRINSVDTLMFTGIINGDAIEYLSLERIRITGYASYVDLNWRLHRHLNSEDVETVDKVYNYTGSYSDKTTEANEDTINDVPITYSSVNHALYIGQSEQFFGMQVKYSTKGVQAANTTVVWEFSKGSDVWATLDVLDETRAFTEDVGTYYITIPHKPSDWAKDTVNSVKMFWIRARLSAGSYTTSPKLDRIKITNIDVYRVYYFETAANSIMDDVLAGSDYSMDAVDTCPSTEISIVAEYETKLRMIPGIANALTWDDSGDKKGYQWWIDTSKKVHFKQKRGATHGDITSELTILNNVEDYYNLTNRLHFNGNYDGLNQLRAVIENTDSQDTHEIRELAVPEERYNNYIPLKEAAQKAMTHTKAPLQKIAATVTTKYWLDNALEVGDTVTLHQDRWNVTETAFQIVRADIGPRISNMDLGISQEHLDGLKAGLQRQMDISGIRMHGSTLILQFGPNEMNYQRVDDTTVYPSRLKFEIPNDARYIHKVLISWKMGNYRADVSGGAESEGHDHAGAAGAGGAHDHAGFAGAGGAHLSSILPGGVHTPYVLSSAHSHSIDTPITLVKTIHTGLYPPTSIYVSYESSHTHTNPTTGTGSQNHVHGGKITGGPSGTTSVVYSLQYGDWCEACNQWLVNNYYNTNVASSGHTHNVGDTWSAGADHTHNQGNTGTGSSHRHTISSLGPIDLLDGDLDASLTTNTTNDDSPAHGHTGVEEGAHPHTGVAIGSHTDHVISSEPAHANHAISTEGASAIDLVLGIIEVEGGTTMMLIVNGETVASNYNGDQTDVVITGYTNTGSNTVEIQPIVGANTKGSTSTEGRGILFIETSSF